ncbi:hypothetical protein [Flavobacterium limnophilum]|uniref:hypothetical protein n=1 Tax=Flavobacterium limnophilum TaxID=3003262 RepID=UPI0024826264|nr:hypothetical protein [Flavobacterium limnophilum]
MKTKNIILAFCLFCQFCFGQTLTRKPLHGMVVNDSVSIQSGYVLNVNSNSRAFIKTQGFFDIMAKTNDTLLFSSMGLKPKKIVLSEKDFAVSVLIIKMNTLINPLKEVVVTNTVIKPNLGNIQNIIDTEYFDDKQSSPDNPLMPTEIKYGMDVDRIGKMIWKSFFKENVYKDKEVDYGDFTEIVPKRIHPFFFTNTLKLKEDEIGLFLIYCENDPKSKALLKPEAEFELIEFLVIKNEEFKRFTTFEK